MNVVVSERDGSVVVTFPTIPTKGHVRGRVSLESMEMVGPERTIESTTEFKLTLHTSGRVNFGRQHEPIFVEPIWFLTKSSWIFVRRIASLDTLTKYAKAMSADDVTLEVPAEGPPFAVELSLWPSTLSSATGTDFQISIGERLHLGIRRVDVESQVPKELFQQTVSLFPSAGTESAQVVPEDIALIDYVRLIQGKSGPWLFGPNGEGVYRLIFETQMRIPPLTLIRALDAGLETEIVDQTTDPRTNRVQVRFKFRDRRSKKLVKVPVEIAEIVVDAEM
jgi:hypothetical protein